MTPFEEFRLWVRQGAPFERTAAAVAAIVALALVAWVLVPPGRDSDGAAETVAVGGRPLAGNPTSEPGGPSGSDPGTAGPAAGGSDAGGTPGPTSAGQVPGGQQQQGRTGGQNQSAPTQSTCPAGSTDQGVTEKTITIAVILLNVAGGNSILGVPEPGEQRTANEAMVKYINEQGGIKCRKLEAKYYTDNPLESNSEHAICLEIIEAKVFAVIGGLYQPQNATCLPQAKIPSFTQTIRPTSEMRQFSPYLFTFYNDSDSNFRTLVAGAKERGFFNGMKKLGVITYQCFPEYAPQLFGALERAGFPKKDIATFDYGCPPGGLIIPPSTVAQAVSAFQGAGVDRVMSAGPNLAAFSGQAERQSYRPKYVVSGVDTTLELTNSGGFAPDRANFNGALGITNSQYGALNSPGTALSGPTAECDRALTQGGAQKTTAGIGYMGGTCNQFRMFWLGSSKAQTLTRAAISSGLNTLGRAEQSYPGAPALWNNPAKTWAGPYWRPVHYEGECNCWKVDRADFSDASV